MNRSGETVTGYPVFSCPWCLVVYARGPKGSVLKEPETPRWKGPETARRRRVDRW